METPLTDDTEVHLPPHLTTQLASAVRIGDLVRTGRKALLLGLASWVMIAAVAYAGVTLTH